MRISDWSSDVCSSDLLSFDLNDRLRISAGARWTRDKKVGEVFKANYLGTLGSPLLKPFASVLPPPFDQPQLLTDYTNDRTFEDFTPRLSITWEASDDVNLYAASGRGFISGGIDHRGAATATPDNQHGFDSEIVASYEFGHMGHFQRG